MSTRASLLAMSKAALNAAISAITFENAKTAIIGYFVFAYALQSTRHIWGTGIRNSVRHAWFRIQEVR
jgi:hypothetical protein